MKRVSRSTGKIEIRNHPTFHWLGTGFVVGDGLVVTARHVAVEFSRKSAEGWVFKRNMVGQRMVPRIDFAEYHGNPTESEYSITGIRYVADETDTDLAILEVEDLDTQAHPPLDFYEGKERAAPRDGYVVGYPSWDGRVPREMLEIVFGNTFDVKALMPGSYTYDEELTTHDCSTVGGTAGAPLVDLETGAVVGINFAGMWDTESSRKKSYAVPAKKLQEIMEASARPPP